MRVVGIRVRGAGTRPRFGVGREPRRPRCRCPETQRHPPPTPPLPLPSQIPPRSPPSAPLAPTSNRTPPPPPPPPPPPRPPTHAGLTTPTWRCSAARCSATAYGTRRWRAWCWRAPSSRRCLPSWSWPTLRSPRVSGGGRGLGMGGLMKGRGDGVGSSFMLCLEGCGRQAQ